MTSPEEARARSNAREEWSKAHLYEHLSHATSSTQLATTLRRLGDLERAQAEYWSSRLAPADLRLDQGLRPRERLLVWLAQRVGTRAVLPIVAADALRGAHAYRAQPDAAPVLPSELEVASEAAALASAVAPSADLARDHRRTAAASGSLRAAVFGVNDGLVSNLSLVMGVAGAAPPHEFILLAGMAGLLAGACSMAAGEFISVLSQRELLERQLAVERQHIALAPQAERALLARRYQDKGIAAAQAEAIAEQLMADPQHALDTIAREQLGLDPEELGSPTSAAAASFVSFAVGALLPLLPFLLTGGWTAIVASALLSGVALFLVGASVSWFTGRNPILSGTRMLAIGAAAALVTFVIGRLIGVNVAG